MSEDVISIFRDLSAIPTAPFREQRTADYIISFCRKRGIRISGDDMGNLSAVVSPGSGNSPLVFCAHMDHPGFIIEKDSSRNRTTALFYGGVENNYFKGTGVSVFHDGKEVKACITSLREDSRKQFKRVYLKTSAPVSKGDTGMWDLPGVRISGDILFARSCDDTVGVAAILTLLGRLSLSKSRKKVMAVFTAAEEGGLFGAKYVCMKKRIPARGRIIAIETSRELPGAEMGKGVVVRVGDRVSVFNPGMTAFMCEAGKRIQSGKKGFSFQRQLMSGGVCESTVYQRSGYTCGAVCVPLGNYHNRDFRRGKIAPEYVSVSDLKGMVDLFSSCVKHQDLLDGFLSPSEPQYRAEYGDLGEVFVRDIKKS